jgi:hypothetical protein
MILVLGWASVASVVILLCMIMGAMLGGAQNEKLLQYAIFTLASIAFICSFIWGYMFLKVYYGA